MDRSTFLAAGAAFVLANTRGTSAAQVTQIPMTVENNHIYAYFGYPDADGVAQKLLTQIDTGGGALLIARKSADELGLKMDRKGALRGFLLLEFDHVFVGSDRVHIPVAATTVPETTVFHPGASSPAFFAASVLRNHAVTFDYIGGGLALDGPPLGGASLSVGIAPVSAFPRVELIIDGETMGFLLDTGASFTMLSQTAIDKLRAKHPSWSYVAGAYGPANMIGGAMERNAGMLNIPEVQWGPFELESLNVVSRPAGTFEKYMSSRMSAPIVGALGGNALRNFTLRLDYPRAALEARYQRRPWPEELTIVPLIVEPRQDGSFTIAGSADSQEVTGKRLVAVEGQSVDGLSLFAVQQLLRGAPGTPRTLQVQDEGTSAQTIVLRTVNVL